MRFNLFTNEKMTRKKNNIFIRVDENIQIGSGHISRCYALACILKAKFEIVFFVQTASKNMLELIKSNFNLVIIDNNNDFLSQLNCNIIVVLDGYHFSSLLQKEIKEKESILVAIDERLEIQYYADIIISFSPQLKAISFKKMVYTQCYLGLKYLFLKKDFLEESKKHKLSNFRAVKSALISFGGSDKENLSSVIAKILLKLEFLDKIFILVGPLNCNSFEDLASEVSINLIYSADEKKIIKISNETLFAITSPSTIMLELFAVGLPIISGYSKLNQNETLIFLSKNGFIESVGNFNSNNLASNLKDAIKNVLSNPSKYIKKQKLIFDNQERNILSIFEKI